MCGGRVKKTGPRKDLERFATAFGARLLGHVWDLMLANQRWQFQAHHKAASLTPPVLQGCTCNWRQSEHEIK